MSRYYSPNLIRDFFSKKVSVSEFNFKEKIYDFKVFSLVRSPMECLVSQFNWLNEIPNRGDNFLLNHNMEDLAKISYYLSCPDNSWTSTLSRILNLNMLNSQSSQIASQLLIDPTSENALKEVKKFCYIGRTETLKDFIKKITYPEFDFPANHSNKTTRPYLNFDELDAPLKNFIYKKMKPDFLLYEAVHEHFG